MVLIMAAGDATRCFEFPKQLLMLPIGETVLDRQVRQIRLAGHEPIVVTHRKEIIDIGYDHFVPENRATLCNSILSTEELWEEKTVIVLGDVVFTQACIDKLLGSYKPCHVVGNEAEIYGMSFVKSEWDKVVGKLQEASEHRLGKLRYFYKVYAGLPIEGPEYEHTTLAWHRDETNDIDDMATYINMVARWNGDQPGY